MEKIDLDKIDSIDIEDYTQVKIKSIDSQVEHVFHVYEDSLDDTLVAIVETIGKLTKQLLEEKLLLKYYTHCFNHIKEKLMVQYKYGSIRDLDRIESMIENSDEYKKYDGMVFSQNLICEHIEMRMKIIKNQIFNIKDIIDIKRIEIRMNDIDTITFVKIDNTYGRIVTENISVLEAVLRNSPFQSIIIGSCQLIEQGDGMVKYTLLKEMVPFI